MQASLHHQLGTNQEGHSSVYHGIKSLIMSHDIAPGKRIRLEPLADKLYVSNTPVREALIQLAAENLINDIPNGGFFVKEISESEIRDLYVLNRLVLDWSLSAFKNNSRVTSMLKPPKIFGTINSENIGTPHTAVQMMDELFSHISRQSGNTDIIHLVRNVSERTHYIRLKECEFVPEVSEELSRLCQLYHQRNIDSLKIALESFHNMRLLLLPDLIRMIRQNHVNTDVKRLGT